MMRSSAPAVRILSLLVLFFGLSLPPVGASEQPFESLAAVHAGVHEKAVLDDARQLKQAIASAKSPAGRSAALHSFAAGTPSQPHREAALFHLARMYADTADLSLAAENALVWLAAYRPRVLVPHPEGRGRVMTPAFPIPTRAKGALNELAYIRQYDLTLTSLSRGGGLDWAQAYPELSWPEKRATLEAVANSSSAAVHRALRTLGTHSLATALLAGFAEKIGNTTLFLEALARADAPTRSSLLRRVERFFPEPEALHILSVSLQGSEPAVAVSALGNMAVTSSAAKLELLALLGDRRVGAAAALVLGPIADATLLQQIEQRLLDSKDPKEQTALLLTLKHNESAQARQILLNFIQEPSQDDQQSAQVKQWIR